MIRSLYVITERRKPIFIEFIGPTVHTATLYAIWKLIVFKFTIWYDVERQNIGEKCCLKSGSDRVIQILSYLK